MSESLSFHLICFPLPLGLELLQLTLHIRYNIPDFHELYSQRLSLLIIYFCPLCLNSVVLLPCFLSIKFISHPFCILFTIFIFQYLCNHFLHIFPQYIHFLPQPFQLSLHLFLVLSMLPQFQLQDSLIVGSCVQNERTCNIIRVTSQQHPWPIRCKCWLVTWILYILNQIPLSSRLIQSIHQLVNISVYGNEINFTLFIETRASNKQLGIGPFIHLYQHMH